MVFPKPGLEHRYKFKLPDHVQRKRKPKIRDPTKIYDFLTVDELFDIRGVGLAILSEEESAMYEKEAKENEKARENKLKAEAENKAASAASPKSGKASKKRASLMRHLKRRQESKEESAEVTEAKKEDNSARAEQKEQVAVVVSLKNEEEAVNSKDTKKISNRGRKRKADESNGTEEATATTASIVQLLSRDDSSKENESEGTSGTELRSPSDRVKEPQSQKMVSSSDVWKTWRPSSATTVGAQLSRTIEKKFIASEEFQDGTQDRMDTGKVEIKLTALNEFSGSPDYMKSTWPKAKSPKKKSQKKKIKKSKGNFTQLPPTLLGPYDFAISGDIDNPETPPPPPPLQTPGPSNKKPSPSKLSKINNELPKINNELPKINNELPKIKRAKGIKKPRLPVDQLSTTQRLRRVRYNIEKHFAKMPGTAYRCPNMRDPTITCVMEDWVTGKKIWLCLVCHKEELDENGDVMICCDHCEDWYHLRCIGVPDEKYPENMKWYCKRCMSNTIREGVFCPEKFPLYVESTN